jgi:hypothetical protein
MNNLDTLFFPDTVVSSATATRLLLFFTKIYHYLPVDRPPAAGQPERCHGYEPVPLGAERERFSRTIRDIQNNLYDYGERLRQLSSASLTAGQPVDGDEASMSSLAAALTEERQPKMPATSETEELWQARIVLRLAEDLDSNEATFVSGFKEFARREQNMLAGLKGEDELSLGTAMQGPGNIQLRSPSTVLQRCKAWTKLFQADPRYRGQEVRPVLSIGSQECVNILLEAHGKITGKEPFVLFSLPLPGSYQQSDDVINRQLSFFMAEVENTIVHCRKIIAEPEYGQPAFPDETEIKNLTTLTAAWQTACDRFFPLADFGRSLLTLYSLGGVSPHDLLRGAFLGAGNRQPSSVQRQETIIAHLSS